MQDSFYYQEELSILRDLAAEFSRQYPAIAPMLAATGADPDVERILEGAAYLSSFVKHRLDDEFPEIVQGMLQHIFPHYLRPIPSSTLVRFSPSNSVTPLRRGVELVSMPVEGVACRFTTTAPLDILPLTVENVQLEHHPDGKATLSLSFASALPLANLELGSLPIFVAGAYADAVEAHRFVLDRVESVSVQAGARGSPFILSAPGISAGGFRDDEMLLPWPANSFRGYRLLQEFFTLPEKFLFWRFDGLDKWRDRGSGANFTVNIRLKNVPERTPEYDKDAFLLNVVPAVNIFAHSSEPIRLDHHRREYRVAPQGLAADQSLVYSIRRVASRNPADNSIRIYQPLERTLVGRPDVPVYAVYRRQSEDGRRTNTAIAVTWPGFDLPRGEVMSIDLLCTNADLPSVLRVGDLRMGSDSVPKNVSFANIMPPTAMVHPPLGRGTLWRLLSHFHANIASLANADALKKMLGLYVFQNSRDRQRVQANIRKIEALVECDSRPVNRLVRGVMLRGQRMRLKLSRTGFAGYGDLRIFADVLEHFFSEYAAINCFTETVVEESETGDVWRGAPLLGAKQVI